MSEYHLAWFARTHLQDGSSQDGEGTYMLDDAPELNTGGMLFTATSLFSSGIGVVNEDLIPYRGKNSKTESKLYLNYCYSSEDDWSVPAEYEFFQSYELENSDILQSPAVYDTFVTRDSEQDEREEGYLGYNQTATDEMKKQLMEGKAISVSFAADQASPGDIGSGTTPLYLNPDNNKWIHSGKISKYDALGNRRRKGELNRIFLSLLL